jgi:plasmid maintenance system antidote protein VapI
MVNIKGFNPDWTIAPAGILQEEMQVRCLRLGQLAKIAAGDRTGDTLAAAMLIKDVLQRRPLTSVHAEALERATGVSAAMWLSLERCYRADLAAGRREFL